MKLISPYRNIKQYTRISIEPYHMNSDIKNNMKLVLKKKVEKRCNNNGYIDEVYKILEYSDGRMPPENLSGSAIYDIAYHCKICIPIENTVLIGMIRVINQELVVAINGPIMFFLPKEHVDTNVWDIPDGYMNKTAKKKLTTGDYVKIQIIEKRINRNDSQIKSIGKLLDFASSEEVEKYFGNKVVLDKSAQSETLETSIEEETKENNFII